MLALILYQGWRFLELFSIPISNAQQPEIREDSTDFKSGQRPNIDVLIDAHIFGSQIINERKPQVAVTQAPISTKAYRIAGIAYDTNAKNGSVLLEVRPGDMEFIRQGDSIEPNVSLSSVSENAILLNVNGRPERIEYVKVRQPALIKVKNVGSTSLVSEKPADWAWVEGWDQIPERDLLGNLGILLRGGVYVITSESVLLADWNISPGDILMSVNGRVLGGGEGSREILRPLSKPDTVHLLVESASRRKLVRWAR